MDCHCTWGEFDTAVLRLAGLVRTADIPFKYIYGIPRGGLVLAVALSHRLAIPLTLNYDKHMSYEVLVVDDISDSGKTLSALNPILSATIHIVKDTTFMPTFHFAEKQKTDWIIYPWER